MRLASATRRVRLSPARLAAWTCARGIHAGAVAPSERRILPQLGFDIGGSLAKLVVHAPGDPSLVEPSQRRFIDDILRRMPQHPGYEPQLQFDADGGRYYFLRFETRWMDDFLVLAQQLGFPPSVVAATGGGAYKFAESFETHLGVSLRPVDEMEALVKGFHFFRDSRHIRDEIYTYDLNVPAPGGKRAWPGDLTQQPGCSLLVSIGSGACPGLGARCAGATEGGRRCTSATVRIDSRLAPPAPPWPGLALARPFASVSLCAGISVIKVEGDRLQRVTGCSIGGATFWGLCRLMTRYSSFDEAIAAAEHGDNDKVAMLVRDIYGGSYAKLGLPGDIVASDFGKIAVRNRPRDPGFLARPTLKPFQPTTATSAVAGAAAGVATEAHAASPGSVASSTSPFAASATGGSSSLAFEPGLRGTFEEAVTDADLVRGLLVLVLNNTAQVAFTTAKEHGAQRVYFVGNFLREGTMMWILTSALKFWSGGAMRAGFLKHEGYFGAVGALLAARNAGLQNPVDGSWTRPVVDVE